MEVLLTSYCREAKLEVKVEVFQVNTAQSVSFSVDRFPVERTAMKLLSNNLIRSFLIF